MIPMRTLPAALVLVALLALPLASAQAVNPQIVLRLEVPDDPIPAGERILLHGVIEMTVESTAMLQTTGIPVDYHVTRLPEWATAVVTPASDVLPTSHGFVGMTYTVVRPFTVMVDIMRDAPVGDVKTLEVGATIPGSAFVTGKSATGPTQLTVAEPLDPCTDGTLAAQSTGVRVLPDTGALLVGILGVAGGLAVALHARRHGLLPLLVVALALPALAPAASAQGASALVVRLEPLDHALAPGQRATLEGVIEWTADATAFATSNGFQVTYAIEDTPEWASILVTPGSDTIVPILYSGVANTYVRPFQVSILLTDAAPPGALGLLTVAATVHGGQLTQGAKAIGVSALKVATGCAPADTTAAQDAPDAAERPTTTPTDVPTSAPATPAADAPDVTLQTAAAQPRVAVSLVVVTCGVLGALVGAVLFRRLR